MDTNTNGPAFAKEQTVDAHANANGQSPTEELAGLIAKSATPVPAAAEAAASLGPGFVVVGGVVAMKITPVGRRRWMVIFLLPSGEPVHCDELNVATAKARADLIQAVVARLGPVAATADTPLEPALEQRLLAPLMPADQAGDGGEAAAEVDYVAVDEGDAPGLYAIAEGRERRLTNFVARIGEELAESDVDEAGPPQRFFCGTIAVDGRTHEFRMTPEDYSEKLRPSIFAAAGSAVEFLGAVDEVRTAISRISTRSGYETRHVLTSPGWDADFARYIVPGGYVDSSGYHEGAAGDGVPPVDLLGNDQARRLGLRRLDAEQLRGVKRHILDDFMKLHDRGVASALLAAVPLAILIRRAGIASWPALWLIGASGAGKSLAARLVYNFFADADPAGYNTVASWASTGNMLPAVGYGFRDALLLIDDYKREGVDHRVVTRVLQNYSDRTARGRMRQDQSMAATKPIRGLLLSTGEDVPEAGASGLGRSVIIRVPTPPRDLDRLRRCLDHRPLYRGVTADLIRYTLRDGVIDGFKAKVGLWQQHYLEKIAGRGNDARIAANHAALAAAFEVFCDYMADIWGEEEAKAAAGAFAKQYVAGLVAEAVGGVEDEMPAAIFLETLSMLLDTGEARIDGVPAAPGVPLDRHDRAPIVGRVHSRGPGIRLAGNRVAAGDEILLWISKALEEVQKHLRAAGRPELKVSNRGLLDQIAELGYLLDKDGRPIPRDSKGERTGRARLGGELARVVRIRAGTLIATSESATAAGSAAGAA